MITPITPLYFTMAEAIETEQRFDTSYSTKRNQSDFPEKESEMKRKITPSTVTNCPNARTVCIQTGGLVTKCTKGKCLSAKTTQFDAASQMHVSIQQLIVDENNKIFGNTHVEKQFEYRLNRKATFDSIMEMINKNQMPSSMRNIVIPWFKNQQEKERILHNPCTPYANKFDTMLAIINKLPTKQRKIFIDLYEDNVYKQEKVQNERITQEILRETKNANGTNEVEKNRCDKTQVKKGIIKVRDEKDLLQPRVVAKTNSINNSTFPSSINNANCEKEVVKFIKESIEPLPVRSKDKKTKEITLDEVCRNTINLLKFQRTHSVTYMHDILPFLKTIYKEYKSKQMSSISAHEILVLDQISYNIEFFWEISNTERLYKETMLDGHILLSRHITKLIEGFLISLNSKEKLKECTGNFIILMDAALERIHDIDLDLNNKKVNSKMCDEVLDIVKEILCTAYSIALVCAEYESKTIKGGSKTVLDDLNAIKTEVNNSTTNISMCNLLIDSFCDNLCALERKVNNAVLELTVEAFSSYEDEINALYFYCTENKATDKHKKHIDACIGRVDNEMDKILQIGWFAILCSEYSKHSRDLRNNLATIEALEDELVLGLVTIKKRANESYMEIILIRMLEAIKDMNKALYHIMDPLAFCLVVERQVQKTIISFKELIGKNSLCFQTQYRNILRYFLMLEDMINNSITINEDSFEICQLNLITEASNDLKKVLDEIKNRLDQLVAESSNLDLELKIWKRCKVLLHAFSKLITLAYYYEKKEINGNVIEDTKLETMFQKGEMIETTKVTLDIVEVKAQKNLKNRSIIDNTLMTKDCLKVYKSADTPKKNALLNLAVKRVSTRHFRPEKNIILSSKDLEITTVLNEICNNSKIKKVGTT